MTLNDAILAATGGPTVNDGLRAYYNAQGVPYGALQDMERAFLRIQMPAAEGSNQDLWMQYLSGVWGYEGTLNDMLYQYWLELAQDFNPPVNTVLPAVTGNPQSGSVLTCSTGTWTGASTFAYRWLDNGTPIVGQTASTISINSTYIGDSLSCVVTATNSFGTTDATSNVVVIIP